MSLEAEKAELINLFRSAVTEGQFKLSSGLIGSYFIDASKVSGTSRGAYLISKLLFELIKNTEISALAGPMSGSDPIIGAFLHLLGSMGVALKGCQIRKGINKLEGPTLTSEDRVLVIDDITTTANQLAIAAEAVELTGAKVVLAAAVMDRSGGAAALKLDPIPFVSILTKRDLSL